MGTSEIFNYLGTVVFSLFFYKGQQLRLVSERVADFKYNICLQTYSGGKFLTRLFLFLLPIICLQTFYLTQIYVLLSPLLIVLSLCSWIFLLFLINFIIIGEM